MLNVFVSVLHKHMHNNTRSYGSGRTCNELALFIFVGKRNQARNFCSLYLLCSQLLLILEIVTINIIFYVYVLLYYLQECCIFVCIYG